MGGEIDNIRKAGNCGMLLSALSASEQNQLTMEKVKTLAEVIGLDLTYQLPSLLNTLSRKSLVDCGKNGVEVLGLTTKGILEHTSNIFSDLSPNQIEIASLETAELCSHAPRSKSELEGYLADQYKLASKDVNKLITTVDAYKLCDTERLDKNTKIYFNGSLFRNDSIRKIKAVLDTLTQQEQGLIQQVDQQLSSEGCVEKSQAIKILGAILFKKLHSIGIYDVSTVSNTNETVEYITRPAAFNKFGRSDISDAFDLAKAFVASLEYGMNRSYSSRGRIVFLQKLMEKLIAGHVVGPCTAIGQDYNVLELRGVVRVTPSGGGMFSMKLLKKDVGEMALQVLQSGDISEHSLTVFPGSPLNGYIPPEKNRIQARKQAQKENIDVRKALDTLRTTSL